MPRSARRLGGVRHLAGRTPPIRDLPAGRNIFRARVIDSSPTSYTIEVTGDVQKIQAIILLLQPLGIKEIIRTGRIAIAREPIRAVVSQPRPLAKAN